MSVLPPCFSYLISAIKIGIGSDLLAHQDILSIPYLINMYSRLRHRRKEGERMEGRGEGGREGIPRARTQGQLVVVASLEDV